MARECWRRARLAPPRPGVIARWLTVAAAGALAGCAGPARAPSGPLEPTEARIDVIPGRTVVIPVRLGDAPARVAEELRARMDDGQDVPVTLTWIGARPSPGPAPAWLPDPGAWTALAPDAPGAGEGAGFWMLTADIAPTAAGQGMWVGGQRLGLNWLAASSAEPGPDDIFIPPPWPQFAEDGRRRAQLVWFEPEARSPLMRWRFALISCGLGAGQGAAPADTFAAPALEALARQFEDRWAIALDRLRLDDPELARQCIQRLAAAVDFGEAIAPVYEAERGELNRLLADLLSPRRTAEDRTRLMREWLRSLDAARAWVIDDVGAGASPSGPIFAVIGLANLAHEQQLGWAIDTRGGAAPEPIAIAPFSVEAVGAIAVDDTPQESGALRDLEVAVGEVRAVARAQDGPLPARPPGLRLGPLLIDWTLATWRAGATSAIPAGAPGATGALLRQIRRPDGSRAWTVYIEARDPLRDGGVREQARLWFGPRGAPLGVIELDPVAGRARTGAGGAPPAPVALTRAGDRWIAEVEVHPSWIEADGRLRLGFERVDATGRRSAWPRPMLPWQNEPGRALVDLTTWGSLATGGGN